MAFSRGGVKIHEFSTKITVCETPLAFLKKGDEKQIVEKQRNGFVLLILIIVHHLVIWCFSLKWLQTELATEHVHYRDDVKKVLF